MKTNKLDKLIEQEYYKQATGKQINVMDIGKLYSDCRASIAGGKTLEVAVAEGVARHCK